MIVTSMTLHKATKPERESICNDKVGNKKRKKEYGVEGEGGIEC